MPRAVAMFGHSLNPHYFANPPAFTYLLHLLFAVSFGGRRGRRSRLRAAPRRRVHVARASAAALGTLAVWLLYLVGARLFGRGVGLLAAAIEAVAFLPVFYAHLALNDVPTLAPLTLSLLGTAGVLRKGRARDYLLAGVGLGLACATKYTAGIVLLPLVAAIAARYLDRAPGRAPGAGRCPVGLSVIGGVALAGLCALVAFLLANPYALLDSTASTPNSCTSRRSPPKRRASSARRKRAGRLLPVVAHLGARLGARAGGARRRAHGVARRGARSAGCSCPRRCCSSPSWACRDATSGAGCCRSSRSSACWRRSSRCARRSARAPDRLRRGTRRVAGRAAIEPPARRGCVAAVARRAVRAGRSSTASTPASCSRAPTRAT